MKVAFAPGADAHDQFYFPCDVVSQANIASRRGSSSRCKRDGAKHVAMIRRAQAVMPSSSVPLQEV